MPPTIEKAAEREEPPVAFQVPVENWEAAISYSPIGRRRGNPHGENALVVQTR